MTIFDRLTDTDTFDNIPIVKGMMPLSVVGGRLYLMNLFFGWRC